MTEQQLLNKLNMIDSYADNLKAEIALIQKSLNPAPTKKKGLSEAEIARVLAKRGNTINKQRALLGLKE